MAVKMTPPRAFVLGFIFCLVLLPFYGLGESPLGKSSTVIPNSKGLVLLRLSDSRLVQNPNKLQKRTQEYAKYYGVHLESFSVSPPEKVRFTKNQFEKFLARTVLVGDFQNVMLHFNRMALFSTIQTPLNFQISPFPNLKNQMPGQVRLTSEIYYYQSKESSASTKKNKHQKMRIPRWYLQRNSKDKELESFQKEINELEKDQKNGVLTLLLEAGLDGISDFSRAIYFQKIHWQKGKNFQIDLNAQNEESLKLFMDSLRDHPKIKQVRKKEVSDSDFFHIQYDVKRRESQKEKQERGTIRYAQAYSPLGRVNPFLRPGEYRPFAKNPEKPLDPKVLMTQLTVDEIQLLKTHPGFLGVGQSAEILLPNHQIVFLPTGSIVSRYQGKIINIKKGQIEVEERFLNALKEMVIKRSVIVESQGSRISNETG